jgi:hypothetical protein
MASDEHLDAPTPAAEGSGRAFWVALALVTVVVLGAVGGGVAVLLGGGHVEQPPAVAAGGIVELSAMPGHVADHYRFAAAHPGVYSEVPCFCGCDATLGHRFLLDCFVRPGGGWEAHASGCGVCLEEGQMIRSMLARGATTAEIRADVIDAFTMDGM